MNAEAMTELGDFLAERRHEIVDAATATLLAAAPDSYGLVGEHEVRLRLDLLFSRVLAVVADGDPACMVDFARGIAYDRYLSGYTLREVQSAFASLEEALWLSVVLDLPVGDHAAALTVISTAVGEGRSEVGCTYAALTAAHGEPTGRSGGPAPLRH